MDQEWFMMENRDVKAIECSVICLQRELENRDLEPSGVTCLLGKSISTLSIHFSLLSSGAEKKERRKKKL